MRPTPATTDPGTGFVQRSSATHRALAAAEEAAVGAHGIVILGEVGSGRHRLARSLHSRSERAGKPLAVLDCSTFGAQVDRFLENALRRVEGGTALLTNVESLSEVVRVSLARVFGARAPRGSSFAPTGVRLFVSAESDSSSEPVAVLARGIIDHGLGGPVRVPPLRERRPDVPGLVDELLAAV